MIFTAPLALLGLLALPALYFLLRLTPPAAKRIAFPPVALLFGLAPDERTLLRMPIWLLLVRLLAAALVIVGLAGPTLHPAPVLPGAGPVLLVIDNGWAAAADWADRLAAGRQIIAAASQADRGVAIMVTARDDTGAVPRIEGVMTAAQAAQMLAALQPQPWSVDREGAAVALEGATESTRIYLADGITDGAGFKEFMNELRPERIIGGSAAPPLLLPPTLDGNGNLVAHVTIPAANLAVLAQTASGGMLARVDFSRSGDATIELPLAVSNQITQLRLNGTPSAGGTFLLDGGTHAVLIGLAADSGTAETPFLGALFFVGRALPVGAHVITGDLSTLIADKVSVIILADAPLTQAQQQIAQKWIFKGGEIIRFAGPITAAEPDPLNPDTLLAGERRLGGALTWATPQNLAPFKVASPLAGLPIDADASVSRQILADPTSLDPNTVWATLADGTPLVLGKSMGKGLLVAILTTANTEWGGGGGGPIWRLQEFIRRCWAG